MRKIISVILSVTILAMLPVFSVSVSADDAQYIPIVDYMQLNKENPGNFYMYHGAEGVRYGGNRNVLTDSATGYEYGSVEFLNKGYFGIVAGGSHALKVSELDTENTFALVTLRVKEGTTKPETIYIRAGVQDNYYSMVKNNIADMISIGEWSTITVSLKELLGNSNLGNFDKNNDTWMSQADAKINNIRVQCINSPGTTEKSVIEVAQLQFCRKVEPIEPISSKTMMNENGEYLAEIEYEYALSGSAESADNYTIDGVSAKSAAVTGNKITLVFDLMPDFPGICELNISDSVTTEQEYPLQSGVELVNGVTDIARVKSGYTLNVRDGCVTFEGDVGCIYDKDGGGEQVTVIVAVYDESDDDFFVAYGVSEPQNLEYKSSGKFGIQITDEKIRADMKAKIYIIDNIAGGNPLAVTK